jgi:hypothetical protein
MSLTLNEDAELIASKKQKASKKLYIGAWVIEIFAVLIGLGIALMTVYASMHSLNASKNGVLDIGDYTNIAIASIPFVMVAIVEFTKIPFSEAIFYAQSKIWKITFSICLLFISFITFESAMNGFERNFNALMFEIEKPSKLLVNVREKTDYLNDEYLKASQLTQQKIDDEYHEQYKILSGQKNDQLLILREQMDDLLARSETKFINSLKDKVNSNNKELEKLRNRRDKEIDALSKSYELSLASESDAISSSKRNLQNQFQSEKEKLSLMESKAQKAYEAANFFTATGVKEEWDEKIQIQIVLIESIRKQLNNISFTGVTNKSLEDFNNSVSKIERRFEPQVRKLKKENDKLSLQISKSLSVKEKEISSFVKDKRNEIAAVEKDFKAQISELKQRRDANYVTLKSLAERQKELTSEISKLNESQVLIRDEINQKVGNSQIYRMAQWWWDKDSAADVSRKDVALIATIWFGSLAMLIAVTGVALAFASLVIGAPDRLTSEKNGSSVFEKWSRWMRLYLANRVRTRKVKYVEVDKIVFKEVAKEVPVEKIVFKEVPVEVIKKEIVHIPYYTNDSSLLNLNTDSSFSDGTRENKG